MKCLEYMARDGECAFSVKLFSVESNWFVFPNEINVQLVNKFPLKHWNTSHTHPNSTQTVDYDLKIDVS